MYNPNVSLFALLLYVFYMVITALLFYHVANRFLKLSSKIEQFFTFFSIIFSNVFIFGIIEMGNSVFLVLILLLYALIFKESENKI